MKAWPEWLPKSRKTVLKQLILVDILKGSFIFMAYLIRQLDIKVETDFVQLLYYYSVSLLDKDLAKGMEKNI
ncbi:hypothetical protein KA005_65155 [bacterium]|nr:hypothetical protein [bacterium]